MEIRPIRTNDDLTVCQLFGHRLPAVPVGFGLISCLLKPLESNIYHWFDEARNAIFSAIMSGVLRLLGSVWPNRINGHY